VRRKMEIENWKRKLISENEALGAEVKRLEEYSVALEGTFREEINGLRRRIAELETREGAPVVAVRPCGEQVEGRDFTQPQDREDAAIDALIVKAFLDPEDHGSETDMDQT
jgi:hypothetical protein